MAGGPIFPHSTFPVDAGLVFPNFHVGAGANSKEDEGLGVANATDLTGDAIWRLRFQMYPTLPTGTAKLLIEGLANATSGVAVVNPKWAAVKGIVASVNLTTGNKWTASGSGTNEYYLEASGGGDPSVTHPISVDDDGDQLLGDGTLGSLAASSWGWGNNDTLGFSTVYVRLSDGVDPDTSTAMTSFVAGEEPGAASLNAEGSHYITWYSDNADFYSAFLITLDADTDELTGAKNAGGKEIVMDLTFEDSGFSLAVVSTWIASIIWE